MGSEHGYGRGGARAGWGGETARWEACGAGGGETARWEACGAGGGETARCTQYELEGALEVGGGGDGDDEARAVAAAAVHDGGDAVRGSLDRAQFVAGAQVDCDCPGGRRYCWLSSLDSILHGRRQGLVWRPEVGDHRSPWSPGTQYLQRWPLLHSRHWM